MGCGCGKKTNVIRQSTKNNSSAAKSTKLDREARKKTLKMIRVNASKRQAPNKKQK
jgi:hypothetical protein